MSKIVLVLVSLHLLFAPIAYGHDCQNSTRLVRGIKLISYFQGFEPGFAQRWYQRLRQPSFCTMVLCHGQCADLMHANGAIWDNSAPCPLLTFHSLLAKTNICCRSTKPAHIKSKI